MRSSEIRALAPGDHHVMKHLGIKDGVRLDVWDSTFWYYDSGSRTLHEWSCSCRACTVAWRWDTPSKNCRFKHKYVAHDAWPGIDESDLRAH